MAMAQKPAYTFSVATFSHGPTIDALARATGCSQEMREQVSFGVQASS
jgi:hypothetical protein